MKTKETSNNETQLCTSNSQSLQQQQQKWGTTIRATQIANTWLFWEHLIIMIAINPKRRSNAQHNEWKIPIENLLLATSFQEYLTIWTKRMLNIYHTLESKWKQKSLNTYFPPASQENVRVHGTHINYQQVYNKVSEGQN